MCKWLKESKKSYFFNLNIKNDKKNHFKNFKILKNSGKLFLKEI